MLDTHASVTYTHRNSLGSAIDGLTLLILAGSLCPSSVLLRWVTGIVASLEWPIGKLRGQENASTSQRALNFSCNLRIFIHVIGKSEDGSGGFIQFPEGEESGQAIGKHAAVLIPL